MSACACQVQPEIGDSPTRIVTIVHGTYARHAKWMQDGQRLPDALGEPDGTLLRRFCWRGRNRHADRAEAAIELRAVLVDLTTRHPAAEHHVVAHSHGGNVVLDAVSGGGEALRGVTVTTLGTPFLSMKPRPVSKKVLAFATFVSVVFVANLVELLATERPFDSATDWIWLAYYGLWTLVAFLAITFFATSASMYRRATDVGWWDLLRGRSVDSEAGRVTARPIDDERLFIVTAQGDEAAALLGAGQLASWILKKTLAGSGSRATVWILGLAFVLALLLPESGVVSWIPVVPIILIPLFIFSLTFSYLPFGIDMLFWSLHADVTAGPAPQGYSAGFQAGGAIGDGLSHSAYDDPEVIGVVAARVDSLRESAASNAIDGPTDVGTANHADVDDPQPSAGDARHR